MPQTNYVLAYRLGCEELAKEKDPRALAVRAECRFDDGASCFELPVLGRLYRVAYPSGEVTAGEAPASSAPAAPTGDSLLTISILAVHYLTKARGLPVTGEWIAFRELPGADIYNVPFTNRTIRPMVARFGADPETLAGAAMALGGRRGSFGHVSAVIDVFPRLPLCFVLWEGDEEIPGSGQILFDRSASAYLDTEDLVVAAAEALYALRAAAAGASGAPPRPGTLEPS